MRINVDFDTRGLEAKTLRAAKRLAYNTTTALNKTALATQERIRERMEGVFKLRSAKVGDSATRKTDRAWLLQQVKVKFASVKRGTIYAEVYIQPRDRLLLGGLETGAKREPFVGKNVGVPVSTSARKGGSLAGAIKPELAFKALKLRKVHVVPRLQHDRTQFKGAARTFLLKRTQNAPLGGVFQRVGPGRDDIRLIYSFRRAFLLRKMLEFVNTSNRTMKEKFRVEWAIATAGDRR